MPVCPLTLTHSPAGERECHSATVSIRCIKKYPTNQPRGAIQKNAVATGGSAVDAVGVGAAKR